MPGVHYSLYVSVDDAQVIEEAIEQSGKSNSEFFRDAAVEKAREVVE